MTIGQRIKTLRHIKNLTQEDLGKMIGVGKATIARYESGAIDVKRTIAIRLAEIFDVTPSYLMGWCNEVLPINETSLSEDTEKLLFNYNKLNSLGKEKASEYVADLTTTPKYTETFRLKNIPLSKIKELIEFADKEGLDFSFGFETEIDKNLKEFMEKKGVKYTENEE